MVNSRGKHWAFTLNNYTADDEHRMSTLPGGAVYLIYGREVGENLTRHLQGHVSFSTQVYFNTVKDAIGLQCHIELARSVQASIQYCKKDGDYVEFGELPARQGRGHRSDLDDFKDAVKGGMTSLKDIREHHSDVYGRMQRFCIEYIQDNSPLPPIETFPLRLWQQELNQLLIHEPCSRKVNFVVDVVGNSGKSWFCHYYCRLHENAQVLLPGKKADMAFALRTDVRVLFIDAPRSKQSDFLQYDFFEDVKNGYIFSTKYESRIKYLNKCHVVVCMNEQPDLTKLSADRYNIININDYE